MLAPITAIYAALSALFITALAFNIARWRRRLRIGLGTGDDERLTLAVRAHGNAVETLPLALLLLLLLEVNGAPGWSLHVLGVLLLATRAAHAEGLLRHGGGQSSGRFYGTLGTWLVFLAMAVGLGVLALAG